MEYIDALIEYQEAPMKNASELYGIPRTFIEYQKALMEYQEVWTEYKTL